MRILLFEFVSGGGWWKVDPTGRPPRSLLLEGKTMLATLARDFAALPNTDVVLVQDRRVKHKVEVAGATTIVIKRPVELFRRLVALAKEVDYAVMIAPEFDDHLRDWSVKWQLFGGKLLSPDPEYIRLAASKSDTAACLAAAGVRVPRGVTLDWPEELPQDFPLPAVLKPDDGAGSQGILYVQEPRDGRPARRMNATQWRLEEFLPGLPASIALLCGPAGNVILPACLQWLSDDRKFRYRGGMTPLSPQLNARARRLAEQVAAAMPPTVGYVGIDLILGDAADGSGDCVIEVNPRLTTSYIGLRAICQQNLAQAMLDAAAGKPVDLTFDERRVQFTPDGEVVALS